MTDYRPPLQRVRAGAQRRTDAIERARDRAQRWDEERQRLIATARELLADPDAPDEKLECVLDEVRSFDRVRQPHLRLLGPR